MYQLLIQQGNSGNANAPQRLVMPTFPLLFHCCRIIISALRLCFLSACFRSYLCCSGNDSSSALYVSVYLSWFLRHWLSDSVCNGSCCNVTAHTDNRVCKSTYFTSVVFLEMLQLTYLLHGAESTCPSPEPTPSSPHDPLQLPEDPS